MIQFRPWLPHLRFASLRSRLFAAFVGVLVLSLLLTGVIFWAQIRLLNTQRVRAELQSGSQQVKTSVNSELVRYWQTTQPGPVPLLDDLTRLRNHLVIIARNAGVRIVLTDYCNNIAIDTSARNPLQSVAALRLPATCGQMLDDTTGGSRPQPVSLNIGLNAARVRQVQQTNLPGTGETFYQAFPPPPFFSYAQIQGGTYPLLVSTIIIAKSTSSVGQDALSTILPRLAVAGIFALGLTLVVVALIVRAIIRPLRTMTTASEQMTRGEYNQRVPDAGNDEVGQLARSFNRMANEVSRAREHQRQFIANVSHDLKTPLTSILGFSQILLEKSSDTSALQQRAAQVINEEARRLQRLTIDLLDLSRLEAGQLPMKFAECDLSELAGKALLRYSEIPGNAAIRFNDNRAPGPLPIQGDQDRLMQILVNLLDNAVKFCGPGGSVTISTTRENRSALLTVANTGIGLSEEDLTRVFQRFYRTDHSRAMRTGGAGLGLAIVQEIVTAHGGNVRAHTDPDGWTRFTVSLPVHGEKRFDPGSTRRNTES